MQSVISPQYQQLLQQHQLANFEQLWHYQGDWFEPPNRERGGWSGVNFIELTDNAGKQHGFYLKRQQAHTRRTWRHPFAGEPTFVREFKILDYLKNSNVLTPKLVFFDSQKNRAILVTEALAGFTAVSEWLNNHQNSAVSTQRLLMRALAKAVSRLHQVGVVHRSLYLKHLFIVELNGDFEVALIDFEKSRTTSLIAWFRFADLITLHYRTANLKVSNKLAFFKHYLGVSHLNSWQKRACCYIHRQSLKKSSIK